MLKKDITFIHFDTSEKEMYTPIKEEAERRGYTTRFTKDKFAKCEIGFYCQHDNFPSGSKLSVIMLHDIIQDYNAWPDLWMYEAWDKYDIGILPSEQWVNNWNQCSQWYYANPKRGMYLVGWPKADVVDFGSLEQDRKEFYAKYGLDPSKKTILYAPAWENDHKQDDFVQAMLKLDVNILIKQYDAKPDVYPDLYRCINEMYELHKDIPRVTILPTSTNIFNAIKVSDVLVSEESSTICEAAMLGKPAVSVSDWLIPDVTPSRFPICNYDFAVTTPKAALSECVRDIVDNYDRYAADVEAFKRKNFANIGNCATMIMDIIDDVVAGRPTRQAALKPAARRPVAPAALYKHLKNDFYRQYMHNWEEHKPLLYKTIHTLKSLKKKASE